MVRKFEFPNSCTMWDSGHPDEVVFFDVLFDKVFLRRQRFDPPPTPHDFPHDYFVTFCDSKISLCHIVTFGLLKIEKALRK